MNDMEKPKKEVSLNIVMSNAGKSNGELTEFQKKWKSYAVANDKEIKGFFGDYHWLSNFHTCPVWFEGMQYLNSECAYQAAKVHPQFRQIFTTISAADSRKEWKKYPLVDKSAEEWDARKFDVMSAILFDKFYRNKDIRSLLLDTDDRYLVELNHWSDSWWGVDIITGGQNNLGKILMYIRAYWWMSEWRNVGG